MGQRFGPRRPQKVHVPSLVDHKVVRPDGIALAREGEPNRMSGSAHTPSAAMHALEQALGSAACAFSPLVVRFRSLAPCGLASSSNVARLLGGSLRCNAFLCPASGQKY